MKTVNDLYTQKIRTFAHIQTDVPRLVGTSKNTFLSLYIIQIKQGILERQKNVLRNKKGMIESLLKKNTAAKVLLDNTKNCLFKETDKMRDLSRKEKEKVGSKKKSNAGPPGKKFISMKVEY